MKKITAFLILFMAFIVYEAKASSTVTNLGAVTTWTKNGQQVKGFTDTTNSKKWVCTMAIAPILDCWNTANVTSSGIWTKSTSITLDSTAVLNGGNFDVYYQASSNSFLVSYYRTTLNQEMSYIRGTISTSSTPTISWSTITNFVDIAAGVPNANGEYNMNVWIDGNGKVIVVSALANGNIKVDKSTTTYSSSYNQTSGDFNGISVPGCGQYCVSTKGFNLATAGDLFLFSSEQNSPGGTGYLRYLAYKTSTWGSVTTIASGATVDPYQWGAIQVSTSSNFMLGIIDNSVATSAYWGFYQYTGSALNTKTSPPFPSNGLATNSGVALSTDGTDVYAFIIRGDSSKSLSYCKYIVSSNTWCSNWNDLETTTSGNYVSAFPIADSNSNLGVLYQTSNGNVQFACVTTTGGTCASLVNYQMDVTPTTNLSSSGFAGGPFSPSSTTYTITNNDNVSINWVASSAQSWITVSPSSGTLAVGASVSVLVFVNNVSNSLVAGNYNSLITFSNVTDSKGNTTRTANLSVSAVSGGGTPSTAPPVLFFQDILSGPSTGNGDGVGSGTIITIWGANLGSSQGTSTVQIGSVVTDHVYCWGNANGSTCGGPAILYNGYQNMQAISFSIPSSAVSGLNTITVTVNGITSNNLSFTVRSGNIYYVTSSGNNGAAGTYAAPWATIGYALDNSVMVAGDIVYLKTSNTEGFSPIGHNAGAKVGTSASPFAVVGYPGYYPTISNSTGTALGNWNNASQYWTVSKLTLKGMTEDLDSTFGGRAVGNEMTQPVGVCATDQAGVVTGGNFTSGGTKSSNDSYKVLGNYVHDWGCPSTSTLEHVFYLSNRTGSPIGAFELGWNFVVNNNTYGALHVYDEGVCGDWTGTILLHDNAVVNSSGEGAGTAAACNSPALVTVPISIYNNLFVNNGRDTSGGGGHNFVLDFQGSTLRSVITIENNTIYGYGDVIDTPTGGGAFREDCNAVGCFGGSVIWKNNIVVATNNLPFAFLCGACPAPITHSNNLWYTIYGQTAPSWDTSPIITNPNLVNPVATWSMATASVINGGNYSLNSNSPAIGTGSSTCPPSTYDILGTLRGSPCDIGVYQYLTGGGGTGGGGGGTGGGTTLAITVSPGNSLTFAGTYTRIPVPQSVTFTVTNVSNLTPINGTISKNASWSLTSATLFTLAPLASTTFTYGLSTAVNATTFVAGTYLDTLTITNTTNNAGTTVISVALIVSPAVALGGGPTISPIGLLRWIPVAISNGYKVYITLTSGGATHQVKDVGLNVCSSTLCQLQISKFFGLLNGTGYFISISSYNGSGESAQTPQLPFNFGSNVPQSPITYSLTP